MKTTVIAALYKFVPLEDYTAIQAPLEDICREKGVTGTILLAAEGLNGTIAGTRSGIDAVLGWLRSDSRMADLDHKESYAEETPFYRIKVRLKTEIVTIGRNDVDPLGHVGKYVEPEDWNELISQPDVLLIDTRNNYEVDIGTFHSARNPHTESFREFPAYVERELSANKDKKIAMFCTGGIRCEKATSFLLDQGFEEIYHLKGGILKYLERVPSEESMWEGECFVFDNRVSVNHDLEPGIYDLCHACRHPITEEDMQSPLFEKGASCPYCHGKISEEKLKAKRERQKQVDLAKKRKTVHIGPAHSK